MAQYSSSWLYYTVKFLFDKLSNKKEALEGETICQKLVLGEDSHFDPYIIDR